MSFVPAIKTTTGKKQIDYSSMANTPNTLSTITVNGINITATKDSDALYLKSGNNIEFEVNGKLITIHDSMGKNRNEITQRIADDIFESFILSDETKEKHGLSSTATVDNILQKFESENPVGTLKNSIATSLGDGWLRCDGSAFDVNVYPELAKLYPSKLPSISTGYGYVYIKAK